MYLRLLKETYSAHGILHHACLIQGDRTKVIPEITAFIEGDLKMQTHGNPDVVLLELDSFGIADGRALCAQAARKTLGTRQIFITAFNTMTHEAQNALLKLFEEPAPRTHFFLITPNTDKLLATLRSRMYLLEHAPEEDKDMTKRAKAFMEHTKAERLKDLRDIIESKDKESAARFLDALLEVCYRASKKKKTEFAGVLEMLTEAKQYVADRGSSLKLLLEHVALILPKS